MTDKGSVRLYVKRLHNRYFWRASLLPHQSIQTSTMCEDDLYEDDQLMIESTGSRAPCSAICQGRMLIFSPKSLILFLYFTWNIFFDPPRGQVVKKCFLAKALFAIFPPFRHVFYIDFNCQLLSHLPR